MTLGSEILGYRLTSLIGEGGMGAVYLAEDAETGCQVALKVMLSEHARSEEFRGRFEREWRYASSLNHPNIIRVHEVGEQDGVLCMVMDYVRGRDLGKKIAQDGPLDPDEAIEVLGQLANALDAVHATGLYHRDVKPANVVIAPGEGVLPLRCYLTDFGLSKRPSRDSKPLTAFGSFVGTLDYTAPEQILGKELDSRVDVYSLGCVLYECLTGTPPFQREREDEVLYAHIQEPPPSVTERRPELPAGIDDVIAGALAKEPVERFANCAHMVEAARVALAPILSAFVQAGARPIDAWAQEREPDPEPQPPPAEPEGAARTAAERHATVPRPLSLRLRFDTAPDEVEMVFDAESAPVRFVRQDGRWRLV